jgi:predicted esterase YcpF (UPF0227 family)
MTPFEKLRDFVERNRMQSSYTKEQIIELIDLIYLDLEKKEKLIYQLFMGKVSEVIGFEEAVRLYKEAKEEVK